MGPVLLRTTLATLLAIAGAAVGLRMGAGSRGRLMAAVFVAAGVLLGVTLFDILPEAKSALAWPAFVGSVFSGWALFWLVERYVFHLCPACSLPGSESEPRIDLSRMAPLLTVAMGIHATLDGVALVVGDSLAHHANIGVLVAVSLHKAPEGMALALLLLGAGCSPRSAFTRAAAIEAATEAGGLLGVLLLRESPVHLLSLLFGHVGGGFLFLVTSTFISLNAAHLPRRRALVAVAAAATAATASLLWLAGRLSS